MTNNTTAGFHLSKEQERVWAQHQSAPPYFARCIVLLEGPLRPEVLREALGEIVRHVEILRTAFHRQAGMKLPFQVILDSNEPAWNTIDLSSLNEAAQQIEIAALAQNTPGFDLQQGPILQASLATLSSSKHASSSPCPHSRPTFAASAI